MKGKRIKLGILVTLAGLLCSPAMAFPGKGSKGDRPNRGVGRDLDRGEDRDERGPRGRRHLGPIPFKVMDTDESGEVTYQEFKTARDKRLAKIIEHREEKTGEDIEKDADRHNAER